MAEGCKIAFIGAGSASFGIAMLRDVFAEPALAGSTLTLVDIDPRALDRMGRLADVLNRHAGAPLRIERTGDRRAALDGADFVVNATCIDRNRLLKLGFEVTRKHGFRQTVGENGGPGGLFFTLRAVPQLLDIARDVEAICPQALFINLSNPESRLALALGKYTRIKALGLCHGIFMARDAVASILGLPPAQVELWGAGLNHFQWLLHIRDRNSGKDLYPLLREREPSHDPAYLPLTRRLFHAFGHWVSCSDEHVGEYLPYGWEAGEQGYDFAADERGRVFLASLIDAVASGSQPIPAEWLTPSGERVVPVIAAVLRNQKRLIKSGIVYNQGVIPNLAPDLGVEVPVVADAAGIHPVSLGPLPEPIAKLLAVQAGVQQLAVEAAVHASKELALQALLIDPVVNSATAAVALLDELWAANAPYIRPCI